MAPSTLPHPWDFMKLFCRAVSARGALTGFLEEDVKYQRYRPVQTLDEIYDMLADQAMILDYLGGQLGVFLSHDAAKQYLLLACLEESTAKIVDFTRVMGGPPYRKSDRIAKIRESIERSTTHSDMSVDGKKAPTEPTSKIGRVKLMEGRSEVVMALDTSGVEGRLL